ncbi:MAG: hypothetical protein QW331_01650 [Candidatus Woesearchaeota archaeon]
MKRKISVAVEETNIAQATINLVSEATNFGPLAYPLRNAQINAPAHFVIGDRDEVTYTIRQGVRERFDNYFSELPNATSTIIPGTHCFNHKLFDFAPYNKVNPETLIKEAVSFVEKLEKQA